MCCVTFYIGSESTEDTELGYYSVIRTICESWTWPSDWSELNWTELNWITYHNYVFAWHGTVSMQIKSQLQKNCGKQGCSSWAHVLDNVALGKVRIGLLQSGEPFNRICRALCGLILTPTSLLIIILHTLPVVVNCFILVFLFLWDCMYWTSCLEHLFSSALLLSLLYIRL